MKPLLFFFVLFSFLSSTLFSQGDTLSLSFSHNSLERSYLLYVPAAYDGSEAWPLVISMHGYATNAEIQMVLSDMNPVADTAHFLIAYPNGTLFKSNVAGTPPEGLGWQAGETISPGFAPENKTVDDVGFINQLIDEIGNNWKINTNRVYATGWSNGASMSQLLACKLSDRIAAIASIGSTIAKDVVCNASRPVPILFQHGTDDPIVPYFTDDPTVPFYAAASNLQFWQNQLSCGLSPNVELLPDLVTTDNSRVEVTTWKGCNTEFVHYKIIGGGHNWSGGTNIFPFLGNFNEDIHASSEIWNFFSRNPMPARVQLIHGAPNETIDVSVNGETIIHQMAWRTATPYIEVPAEQPLDILLTPVNPWSTVGPVPATLQFKAGVSYAIVLYGTFDESDNFPIAAAIYEGIKEKADDPNSVAMTFLSSVPDFGVDAFDVIFEDGTILFDNMEYAKYAPQINIPAGDYLTFGTLADDNTAIASAFQMNVAFWKGQSLVMFNTGFARDGSWQSPWIALSNGGTFPMPAVPLEQVAPREMEANALNNHPTELTVIPNPANQQTELFLHNQEEKMMTISLHQLDGRLIRVVHDGYLPKGENRFSIELENLVPGVYFLQVNSNNDLSVYKIIKE